MKKNKNNVRSLSILYFLSLFSLFILFFFMGVVSAYSGGSGTCNCGDGTTTLGGNATDACYDCEAALNDNLHCANQVNYVGIVAISEYPGTCISDPANFNNKIFDCQGNTIDGNDNYDGDSYESGIYFWGKTGNVIRNCVITDFYYAGIRLFGASSYNDIINCTINSNEGGSQFGNGIYLEGYSSAHSTYNGIINCTINSNRNGIYAYYAKFSKIMGNMITSNSDYGLFLNHAPYSNLTNNNLTSNGRYSLWENGFIGCTYIDDLSNIGGDSGKPIRYEHDRSDNFNISNTDEYSAILFCRVDNALIDNVTISNPKTNNDGIRFIDSDNITIKNSNVSNDYIGIELNGDNSIITNNILNNNDYNGVLVSSNSNITNNTANSNGGSGISAGSNNNIINNVANNNNFNGFSVHSNNNITNNTANNNGFSGFYLGSSASDNNKIINNTANNNQQNGLYISYTTATGNTINLSTFCNNNQAGGSYYDIWDKDANTGDNNTCDTTNNWDDTSAGSGGCTNACGYTTSTEYHAIINITANQTTLVNATEEVHTSLEIATSQNVTNTQVNITYHTENPKNATLGVPGLGKYVEVDVSPELNDSLDSVFMKVFYTDEEINSTGLNESSLGFYWYDESLANWTRLNDAWDWVYDTGVNKSDNYVWANVTHFSLFTIGEIEIQSITITLRQGWNLISIPILP